ncbi:PLxRFG domain-containing protein [Comamonas sp. w2-DMI]|uniref:PLxRFG domain-containing protein n=1 Tax=Comamonas sp. w2-DMI TaxID=3126391 RepID=UPI0032E45F28
MAKDAAAWAVKGAIAVPEAAVGLADLATGGRAGKFLENEGGAVGFRPKQAREIVNDWHSDATKRAQQEFQQAEGFGGKLKAAVQNPSNIVGAVAESLPSMLAGGAIGRGLTAATRLGQMGLKGATVAGAAGEGVVGAGSAAEQIRQETEDGLLTPGQTGAALATGAMTGAIGYGAGKVANRLGIGDAETMLAQGQAGLSKQIADQAARNATNPLAATAAKSIPRQMVEGAISEGLLEELPQSISEQILQNLALGKPWAEDVDASAVMGLLSGAAMGSGAAGYRALREPRAKAEGAPVADGETPQNDRPTTGPTPGSGTAIDQMREAFLKGLAVQQEPSLDEARLRAEGVTPTPILDSQRLEQEVGAAAPAATPPAPKPSEAMGLDPAAGALSAAAALAVDSGASPAVQPPSIHEAGAHGLLSGIGLPDPQEDLASIEYSRKLYSWDRENGVRAEEMAPMRTKWLHAFKTPEQQEQIISGLLQQLKQGRNPADLGITFGADDHTIVVGLGDTNIAYTGMRLDDLDDRFEAGKHKNDGPIDEDGITVPQHVIVSALTRELKSIKAEGKKGARTERAPSAAAAMAVDQATGEVTPEARLQQVKQRLDFLGQMGRSQGWNNAMVDERNALAAELKQLQAGQPSAPGDQINQLQAQADGADLTAQDWAQREYRPNSKALPEQAAKGGPADVQEANEQRRLQRMASAQQEAGAAREQAQALMDQANEAAQFASKERQSNDQKAQGAINEGAKTDGSEADQTQQGGAQSPQAGTAPAGPAVPGNRRAPSDAAGTAVSGEQGLTHGTAPTEDAGRQAGPAPAPQAQAQVADPAQRLADAGAAWARMPAAERQALAARLDGVKPVLAKNLPRAQWENLNGDIQRKISDAIAQLDQPTHATQNGTTDQVFNTRKAAIDEGERTGAGYSVEPIDGAGPLGPHRLVIQRKPTDTAAPQARAAAVTEAAHEAATSQHNDLPEPTEAQKDAGNYRKGHVRLNGHDISIENPAGSRRRPEWPPLQNHYGYIKGSLGADKDHVDVFMTDRAHEADLPVFVVDQVNKDGSFDEHKVVLGAADEAEARKTYLGNYAKGWTGLGAITQMTQDEFKAWVRDPAKTKKPAGKTEELDAKTKEQQAIEAHGLPPETKFSQGKGVLGAGKWSASAGSQSGNLSESVDAAAKSLADFMKMDTARKALSAEREALAKTVAEKLKRGEQPSDVELRDLFGLAPNHTYVEQSAVGQFLVEHMGVPRNGIRKALGVAAGDRTSDGGTKYPIVYPRKLHQVFGPSQAPEAPATKQPRGVAAKVKEAQAARADYFTPGNIVKSYGGHDRVIAYTPPDADGRWSVTVRAVQKQGDAWVDVPDGRERTHRTEPTPRELKAGPVERAPASEEAPSFRRQESEHLAGADFDVANFLKIMGEGSPAARSAAQLRPDFSPAARAEAVSAVKGTADAIRKAWANGPEVVVAFDMQDPVVPESARRADLKQRSGGAHGAPEGFYYQGKVYLMASKLKTPNDAARVLFHEALGHHGLRGLFGKELGKILNQVATMRKADVDAKIKEYGLRRVNNLDRRTAAEEVLAEMAQNTPEISFVRRAVAAIRSWLRTHVPRFKSLALTDDELIRNYILPARAWVERGAGGGRDGGIAFSRAPAATSNMPDAIIGNTLGAASAHPDYAAAKGGDLEAAVRLAQDLVTPELVAKVKAVIGDTKPLVAPVAAEEATGRNRIPLAAAAVLAQRLGLATTGAIVQANRAHRTGMDGLDRIFAPVDFAGTVEAVPYLLVDDTLTQGGTFAALASHIREGGGTVAGVIALTGKQYSAKIQPSPETLASLRQKHGDLETEFRAATGYGFDALTESEARYLARYEPADRLRDRISAEGHAGLAGKGSGNTGSEPVNDDPVFSRSRLADIKDSALSQLDTILSHPGKVSLWDKTVGTMRHLAERAPAFKPVYESAQQNIDDVSMLANDAADTAPTLLPRVESLGDLKKKPVSAADNKAVATPLFEGTLVWGRDVGGQPMRVEDLAKKYAGLSVHNKAAMLLKANKIDAGVLAMWQGLPAQQYEKLIDSRFESKFLKAGVVWSDKELQTMFGANAAQIGLYREARAAIDRSIDMTARADMLRVLGDEYRAMRDVVLEQPSLDAAAQLLLDTLEQDAKANPDARDRLGQLEQQVRRRLDMARDLQASGYAPLSRFGRFTLDVVDAKGERQYFGLYETQREANLAKLQMAQAFPGATITQGTMSAEAYKLFAGVTPETLEQFGEMLGLNATGDEAQDKAFQEYLRLTKNNHSALKRLIHRKGIAGFSEDVGRVVANFVYSNARAGAMGLNAGAMEKAINAIPKEQGELKDLAMGLRDYIRDPQEEGQAVRGMLFAQYLGGSIASAFVNTTQPFAVTLPWLSQYGGMAKAGGQLARALKDMGRSIADKGFKYEPDLAKALQSAEDDGVVSPQEIHQLMAQARGAGMLRAGDGSRLGNARAKASNLWEQGKVLWGQPFALAEQFNRRSTFIAAYRTAKAEGMVDPASFARRAVIETQFQYSKANKPQWARGAIGGTLFTFKTYSVSYLELMHRMWNQGGPEGKRAVGWAVAMLLLMGGAGGLPFMEDVEDLVDGAAQLMGYNVSAKQWRKQLLADVVGKEVADFMEQGVSGLPGAPVDVSGRLGMGNLIPGTGLFLSKQGRERDLLEIAGPAGDFVSRGFTAARKVLTGDVGGAALEVSPTAVRNLAKGADMAATGMYRDQKGYKVLDTTLAEAAAKAIGFQPKSVAEVQEANSFMQRSKSFYIQQSSEIKAQWADALFRKDEAAVQRVRERLADWNRDNPEQPIVVKMPDIWKRVREMGKDRTQRIADTAPKALREQMREMAKEARAG